MQVTQDTWSKTVGVRWCAQERVHSCVVCGRRRGRLRLARCRVLRTPPPCAEMWCARHRSAAGVPAASTPPARRALRYLGGRAGRRGGGGWCVLCTARGAQANMYMCGAMFVAHIAFQMLAHFGWHLFCDMRYRNACRHMTYEIQRTCYAARLTLHGPPCAVSRRAYHRLLDGSRTSRTHDLSLCSQFLPHSQWHQFQQQRQQQTQETHSV